MARIVLLALLLQSSVVGAQISCTGPLSPTEVVICASPKLLELDHMLGAAYRSAIGVSPDPKALRSDQRNWLRKRNRCDRYDCLKHLYDSRIAELRQLHERFSARPTDRLDARGVMQVCTALARRVDERSLDELLAFQVAGRRLTSDERQSLANLGKWPAYHERAVVYELQLNPDGPPSRIANFWGGQDCRSARMINLDHYFASDGNDTGRDPDAVLGPDIEIALSTAEDRLITLDGRYFVFTGASSVPRASPVGEVFKKDMYMSDLEGSVSIVSLVRPDGVIQPVCELKTETTSMVPRKGGSDAICAARVQGKLPLAPWIEDGPRLSDCCPRPFSNPYDGEDPFAVYVARIGLDKAQVPYLLVRLAYEPGSQCGSVRTWSTTLHDGFREVPQTDLLDLLQPVYTGKATWPEIYQVAGRTFVEVGRSREHYELLEIKDGQLRQLCEFERRSTTRVGRAFDSIQSGTQH